METLGPRAKVPRQAINSSGQTSVSERDKRWTLSVGTLGSYITARFCETTVLTDRYARHDLRKNCVFSGEKHPRGPRVPSCHSS